MARAMTHPMAHPKFYIFTRKKEKRKEKRSTHAHGSSVKRSSNGRHVLYQTHPQALHGVTFQDDGIPSKACA